MSRDPSSGKRERRYSEKEFALILRKAFELGEPSSASGAIEGLSIEEIKAIAREVGLDPSLIERAAAALPAAGRGRMARLFGGPDSYQLRDSAPGEISEADFGQIVDAIREVMGHQGEATVTMGSLEWRTVAQVTQIYVTVSPRDGETATRVFADRGGAALLTFFLPTVLWGIAFGISGAILEPSTAPAVLSLLGAAAGGALLTGRTIWKRATTRLEARLAALMRTVAGTLEPTLEEDARRDR
jgi:hypothetical protein